MRLLLPLLSAPYGLAQAQSTFSMQYQTNDTGANTLMCLSGTDTYGCNTGVMNGNGSNDIYNMTLLNADPGASWPPGRGGSTSATLSLPAGSQVLFAGLYWGAYAAGSAAGVGAYQSITGSLLGDLADKVNHHERDFRHYAVDVTNLPIRLEGVWLAAGYNLGGGPTLRLDLLGGSR